LLKVQRVHPSGAAARLGIRAGDAIVTINGHEIHDVIDYKFHSADERISLAVSAPEGPQRTITFRKDPDDDLGVEFPPLPIKRCRNRCIFCFVDQMPRGCRQSLYVKDDDYRASFLYGNYITLGNLSTEDWDRIFAQRLSPLYLSVHATDPALRRFILGNKNAPDIITNMKRLAAGGIRMHTQIVLCRGINDGPHLVKTLEDLAGLFPMVSSIAVVPVGTTKFRKGLFSLEQFTPGQARAVIETVESFGRRFKRKFGTRLVFPSDEFYIKAKKNVPRPSFYEDFPQIENGVGMVAQFLDDARRTALPGKVRPLSVTVVTGVSFSRVLKTVMERLSKVRGLNVKLIAVRNGFFGPSVTVAGLLSGRDILHALRNKRLGDMILVPANALKEDDEVFLDGMSLERLRQELGVPVMKAESFSELAAQLK
jgi:putative radical SAM enzyme (TIGR03279 family)